MNSLLEYQDGPWLYKYILTWLHGKVLVFKQNSKFFFFFPQWIEIIHCSSEEGFYQQGKEKEIGQRTVS